MHNRVSGYETGGTVMRLVLMSMSLTVLALLAAGCEKQGSAEQVGEELDAAMEEVKDGMKEVQAVLWNPVIIHKDTIPILINDRFYTKEQVYGAGR